MFYSLIFKGWNIGQMSDQNIMDEFERMLENMNLTEEKKVRFASFLFIEMRKSSDTFNVQCFLYNCQ